MLKKFIYDNELSIRDREYYTLVIEISRVQVLTFIAIVTTLLNDVSFEPISATMGSANYGNIEIIITRSRAQAFLEYLNKNVDSGEIVLRGYDHDTAGYKNVAKLLS